MCECTSECVTRSMCYVLFARCFLAASAAAGCWLLGLPAHAMPPSAGPSESVCPSPTPPLRRRFPLSDPSPSHSPYSLQYTAFHAPPPQRPAPRTLRPSALILRYHLHYACRCVRLPAAYSPAEEAPPLPALGLHDSRGGLPARRCELVAGRDAGCVCFRLLRFIWPSSSCDLRAAFACPRCGSGESSSAWRLAPGEDLLLGRGGGRGGRRFVRLSFFDVAERQPSRHPRSDLSMPRKPKLSRS